MRFKLSATQRRIMRQTMSQVDGYRRFWAALRTVMRRGKHLLADVDTNRDFRLAVFASLGVQPRTVEYSVLSEMWGRIRYDLLGIY